LIDLCAGHTKLHAVHAAQKIPTQTLTIDFRWPCWLPARS
jgi:hypothetical protein